MLTELMSGTYRDVLMERKAKNVPVNAREAVDVLLQASSALLFLHDHEPKIIHLDVKADNLFVQRSAPMGEGARVPNEEMIVGRALLGDFGEAVVLDGTENLSFDVGTPEVSFVCLLLFLFFV